MSTKSKNPFADTEYVRAARIEREECCKTFSVAVFQHICTSTRPDRIIIRLEAFRLTECYTNERAFAAYETEWPNVQGTAFSATLFNASVKLTRLVEDSLRDLWADSLRAQEEG